MNEERPRGSRALVVDDHPILHEAVRSSLLSLNVFDGVDTESSMAAASARLHEVPGYDLLILDLHLTDTHGLESLTAVREAFPGLPVIIFSADDSSATIVSAYEYGVQGYVAKNEQMSTLRQAIQIVLAGGIYMPPQVARMLGFEPRPLPVSAHASAGPALPSLSPRQREVMHYLLKGMPNKVIARRLNMADGTVKSHLNTVYRLFGVNSRAQLILKAMQMGFIV
jgi:DNA-binding NarL/FixJ family response regulator